MASTETLKALSSTLSALCAYGNRYSLSGKDKQEYEDTIDKVYATLIKEINND